MSAQERRLAVDYANKAKRELEKMPDWDTKTSHGMAYAAIGYALLAIHYDLLRLGDNQ